MDQTSIMYKKGRRIQLYIGSIFHAGCCRIIPDLVPTRCQMTLTSTPSPPRDNMTFRGPPSPLIGHMIYGQSHRVFPQHQKNVLYCK